MIPRKWEGYKWSVIGSDSQISKPMLNKRESSKIEHLQYYCTLAVIDSAVATVPDLQVTPNML